MFNPDAPLRVLEIAPGHPCVVIDNALREPQRWVELAIANRDAFAQAAQTAFPGPELPFSPELIAQFEALFNSRVRTLLGGRRTLSSNARMSLACRAPQDLKPWQWFCHVDARDLLPGQGMAACVLYLFQDQRLGGTAFYASARPMSEIAELTRAATTLPAEEFSRRYGIAPGYMTESNAWFRKLLAVPARWNRLIFYSGSILHSGDIIHPELLDTDPAQGRLTINGFFRFTRKQAS